jgi:hypothetical protein
MQLMWEEAGEPIAREDAVLFNALQSQNVALSYAEEASQPLYDAAGHAAGRAVHAESNLRSTLQHKSYSVQYLAESENGATFVK